MTWRENTCEGNLRYLCNTNIPVAFRAQLNRALCCAHRKMALEGHFDVTKKSTEKLGNAVIKAACVIHYDSFFNYLVTYYFFRRRLLPLHTGCSELLLMSSYSAVCFIFIVPCVAQGLIYCVLLNPVLRAKSIKRLWPGDLVC